MSLNLNKKVHKLHKTKINIKSLEIDEPLAMEKWKRLTWRAPAYHKVLKITIWLDCGKMLYGSDTTGLKPGLQRKSREVEDMQHNHPHKRTHIKQIPLEVTRMNGTGPSTYTTECEYHILPMQVLNFSNNYVLTYFLLATSIGYWQ